MRAVVTRVLSARVVVDGQVVGELPRPGLLALVGVAGTDQEADAAYIARKIAELRIVPPHYGLPASEPAAAGAGLEEARAGGNVGGEKTPAGAEEDVSALDVAAPVLVVSQFTLYAATRKGRRPSWSAAARGDVAEPMVERVKELLAGYGLQVQSGVFGAMMQVESVNDGPFTLILDSTDPRR
ncbi:MAG: D-aminoacyl-tRNA deacylase [Buchananella hordeovulneris]|nr:D-aminoacyl-tRNA deacylase [Buchananella hordeovulneris]